MSPVGERRCVLCGIKGIRGYHHFPRNKEQRQTWLKHCGLTAEYVKEHDKICFRHFKPDDYFPRRSDNQVRILKKYIVPTRNLPKVRLIFNYSKLRLQKNSSITY